MNPFKNLSDRSRQISPFERNTIANQFLNQSFNSINSFVIKKIETNDPIWDYVPYSHLVNMNYLKHSSNVAIKKFADSEYIGELVDSKRQGKGIMKYDNGRIYEGNWLSDLREGEGFELFENQSKYIGNFTLGKPNGVGSYFWKTGEMYEGEWKDGLKHGQGVWRGLLNDSYTGEWINNKPQGKGIRIWKNGDQYHGDFSKGLKHGSGCDYYSNGDVYIGQFRFGKPYGKGKYIWKNGAVYIGEFINGVKQGYGKWKKEPLSEENSYCGTFFNDMKHGFGVYRWMNGNEYRGQFRNDERDGIGQMTWIDGSKYVGMWSKGVQNGFGRMIDFNGRVREGIFYNNIFQYEANNEEIPDILKDPNFEIDMIAPEDLFFPNNSRIDRGLVATFDKFDYPDQNDFIEDYQDPIFVRRHKSIDVFKHPDCTNPIILDNKIRPFSRKIFTDIHTPSSNQSKKFIRMKMRPKLKFRKLNQSKIWVPNGRVRYNFENSSQILNF